MKKESKVLKKIVGHNISLYYGWNRFSKLLKKVPYFAVP